MKTGKGFRGAAVLCICLLMAGCGAQKEESAAVLSAETGSVQETEDLQETENVKNAGAVQDTEMPDPEEAAEKAITPGKKDEIISVQADASGKPEKIEVSGTLSGFRGEDGPYLSDTSQLTDLKNSTGAEEFCVAEDGTVYWQNLGKDVHYEGVSDAELPADVHVTYFLNGEETDLAGMKGKSGKVKIRFDYEVREKANVEVQGTEQEMTIPFLALSMVMLPEDIFSDVEVSHGSVVMLGGQKAVVGYALPGLEEDLELDTHEDTKDLDIPAYVEITASAEEFELDFTATILKSGLLRNLDEEKLDALDEETGGIDDMDAAVKELEEAAQKLAGGSADLQDALQQYTGGVSEVASAVSTMDQQMGSFDISALGQLAEQLRLAGMEDAGAQLEMLQGGLQELSTGISGLADGTAELAESGQALYDGMTELTEGTEAFRDGISEFRREGMQELTDFFKDDLGDLAARVRGLHLADLQYSGYTPSPKGQEVNTTFLIETKGTE